jgi:hypothetical protein
VASLQHGDATQRLQHLSAAPGLASASTGRGRGVLMPTIHSTDLVHWPVAAESSPGSGVNHDEQHSLPTAGPQDVIVVTGGRCMPNG